MLFKHLVAGLAQFSCINAQEQMTNKDIKKMLHKRFKHDYAQAKQNILLFIKSLGSS
jgi:hypothetical protein